MKLRRNHWIIAFCIIGLLVGARLWKARNINEPIFQGKTANQWFEAVGRRKVNQSEFQLALEVLSTNFLPVFLTFELDSSTLEGAKIRLYKRFPVIVQKWLPHPRSHYLLQTAAMQGMAFLGKGDSKMSRLPTLKNTFQMATINHQSMLMLLIFSYVTGETEPSLQAVAQYHSHPDFLTRFHCAYFITRNLRFGVPSDMTIDTNKVAAVLAGALTNSALMKETFGNASDAWRERIMRELESFAPESDAKHQEPFKK